MLPLYDEKSPATSPAYVTIGLIVINVLIFLATIFSGEYEEVIFAYGAVPGSILEGEQLLGLVFHMFLHGGLFHLIGNMWFLWLFGDNVEYNFGKLRFLLFFFLAGLIAVFVQIILTADADLFMPVVGASGAISGVIGAYVVLYPRNKIRAFMLLFYYPLFFSIPAYFYVAVWFFLQLLYIGSITNVAYMAHIGGFLAGAILVFFFRRKVIVIENYDRSESIEIEQQLKKYRYPNAGKLGRFK